MFQKNVWIAYGMRDKTATIIHGMGQKGGSHGHTLKFPLVQIRDKWVLFFAVMSIHSKPVLFMMSFDFTACVIFSSCSRKTVSFYATNLLWKYLSIIACLIILCIKIVINKLFRSSKKVDKHWFITFISNQKSYLPYKDKICWWA